MVRNIIPIFKEAIENDGDIYYEWPTRCHGWQIKELVDFKQWCEARGRVLHKTYVWGCQYGMKDDQGTAIPKLWTILTTNKSFKDGVERRCPMDHDHCEITGKLTSKTAF